MIPRFVYHPIACALVPFVFACGAPARPGAADMGPDDAVVDESAPFSREDGATVGGGCVPGERRACRIYWRDTMGGTHCTEAVQHCRADGRAWLRCGHPPEEVPVRDTAWSAPEDEEGEDVEDGGAAEDSDSDSED